MKIHVLGGGPAGLYFALLMKKRDRAHEITVFERNARENTFGWGVVFSDKTLTYLRDADEPTHAEIAAAFETWDNVDIVHRGEKVTIRGNRFSGIARIALLRILQARCLELGVDLRFETPVADPAPLARADLLVGADGFASAVRQAFRADFEPTFAEQKNRYIWYGTDRLFHGLTLTFRENEAGLFVAHSYKFDKSRSTFIVECDPETWARAGFAAMPEAATRRYLAEVFREDLAGAPLLSNNSNWIRFAVVKNRRWSSRNVVLLGDALHTAHFSIGSGTKLALEDAIALAAALAREPRVEAALEAFEQARRPIVEAYQEAAQESLAWFENAKDYLHLDPVPFAFSAMTRSKRVDYEDLRRRDPAFIERYERSIQG
jgi:anthraniloyl-CoA monooxygenase